MDCDALGVLNVLASLRKDAECAAKEKENAEEQRNLLEISINKSTKTISQLKEQTNALKKRTERETNRKDTSSTTLLKAKRALFQDESIKSAKIAASEEFCGSFLEKSNEFCSKARDFKILMKNEVIKQKELQQTLLELKTKVNRAFKNCICLILTYTYTQCVIR